MLRIAPRVLLLNLTGISSVVIEDSKCIILIGTSHFYLSWILESQIFLTLPLAILTKGGRFAIYHVCLLFVVVVVRVGAIRCVVLLLLLLLLLKSQLWLWLINILVASWVLLDEVFIIVVENLIVARRVQIKMLPCIQWTTLISLISLWQLLLRWHVKITLSYGKFFHITLWINILYALINIVNRASVFLILRLRQVLKLSKSMLLIDDCIAY
jgi:hypothetical protein